MTRRQKELASLVLSFLIGVLTNVATGTLPDAWKPYLWLSWAPLGVCLLVVVGLKFIPQRGKDASVGGPQNQTTIDGDVYAPVLSGTFQGDVNIYPPVVPPRDARDRQARQAMIDKLQLIWVDGVLRKSLWNDALIQLGLAERDGAVQRPYAVVARGKNQPDVVLPANTRILQVYDEQHGSLLILGAPGSGKTTLLLELMRDLLARARQSRQHPIPVKFDLSAWGADQPKLDVWMVSQLRTQYGVSKKTAEQWVTENVILPLLDGLDEVASARRAACAAAINTYRQEHGLWPMVVCCREREYAELPELHLNGAVVAQPLSEAQVRAFLDAGGSRLDGVRRLLADDPDLIAEDVESGRLLATPLMLSVVTLAYADVSVVRIEGTTSTERRRSVFDTYLAKAMERKAPDLRYPDTQTLRWLRWLAWQLRRASRSTYLIEQMQFSWLSLPWAREARSMRLITTGFAIGLFTGFVGVVVDMLGFDVWIIGYLMILPLIVVGFVFGVRGGVGWGLGLGIPVTLINHIRYGYDINIFASALMSLRVGLVIGVIGGLVGGLIFRRSGELIEIVDRLTWSFGSASRILSNMTRGFVVGAMGFGMAFGVLYSSDGINRVLIGVLAGLVLGGLAGGIFGAVNTILDRELIMLRNRPNQGIRASLGSGLLGGLVGGTACGLFIWLFFSMVNGSSNLINSVLVTAPPVGLISGLYYGCRSAILHATLRLFLARRGLFPLNITPFCDYCADRAILQRVGGGWQFVHRLLLEHLADQYEHTLQAGRQR